jgi:hypothetical protein
METMSMTTSPTRTQLLRKQGLIESGFALATAAMLFAGTSSTGMALIVGAMSVWMVVRGRTMFEHAEPLGADERRELDRLKGASKHVRELVAVLERSGHEPVRYDLRRCRKLARLESLLDGQA